MSNSKLITPENRIVQPANAAADALISRAAQEVQAAIAIAKRFPRDEDEALDRILQACRRFKLADAGTYEYPRGDQIITGPSIRLAEVIAQNWKNFEHGTIAVEEQANKTFMLSYAWDYERNTRSTKQFWAKHIREKKSGNVLLTDPRDVYEVTANFAARRTRACILALIPIEVQDLAVAECDKTILEADKRPRKEQIEEMLRKFNGIGVTGDMLRIRLRHKVAECSEREILGLRKIYTTIADGIGQVGDYFVVEDTKRPAAAASKPAQTKSERMAAEVSASKAETASETTGETETTKETQETAEPWEKAKEGRKGKGNPGGMSQRIQAASSDELRKIMASLEDMPEGAQKVELVAQIEARWKVIFSEGTDTRQPGDEA